MAGKKQKKAATAEPDASAGAAKKDHPQQQPRVGIAAALAAAGQRATTDLVLEQARPRDLLGRRLSEELSNMGEKYLQAWGEKCHVMRQEATAAAAGGSKAGPGGRRTAHASSYSKEDADLDSAGLRFLEVFRHLQQQAFKQDAAFDPRTLELLVLILRSDVVHTLGDVSHQAYSLLQAYLQRFPHASLGRQEGGQHAGRPFVILDEQAAWQPMAAAADFKGITRKYIYEAAIKDAGHNYRLDTGVGAAASLLSGSSSRKKGGLLGTTFELLALCFDRAVDSVEEDYNGDVLLLRYLLCLLQQDLRARMEVFQAYADVDSDAAKRKRAAVLQNALLWRICTDDAVTDKSRQELMRLLMRLIVGVASEADLQEVDEEQPQLDKEAEAAAPCICTPRELAAQAASFLNMLLDMFGAAEAAGGFQGTAGHRMHRHNMRLKWDQAMKEAFWRNASDAVCRTDDMSRTFLAALAPAHRLRLLTLVAMERVSKAYYQEEALKLPAVLRAKELEALVKAADSGPCDGAFPADPVVAMQCLNQDKSRSVKVFSNVTADSAINHLSVLACGIALAAHSLEAAGAQLPAFGGAGGQGAGAPARRQLLLEQLQEFLRFLAERHAEFGAADKEHYALKMSRGSLYELLHAQAALAAMG